MERLADREALVRLAAILCPGDAKLLEEVLLAAEHPKEYFAKFEDDLFERGIETPERVSFWLALVDALAKRKYVREVDWKDQGIELAHTLRLLSARYNVKLDLSRLEKLGEGYDLTPKYADLMISILKPNGLTLIWFDIDSDSYPLCIVPSTRVAEIQALARRLAHRILVFDRNSGDI